MYTSQSSTFQQRHLTTNSTDESEYVIIDVVIPYSIRFILLLIFEIPSIIGYIFVITYILTRKQLRSAPNNYVMLINLFISFIIVILDIPWTLDTYRRNTTAIISPTLCLIEWFIDYYLLYDDLLYLCIIWNTM